MSNIDVSFQLDGLLPFEKYDYAIEGLGGNWPCVVTPISGTIRPYGTSVNLDAIVNFCTTKAACPSGTTNLLPYNSGITDPYPNLYTTIRLSLKPETLDYTLYSDAKIIRCDNCFSQPVINVPQTITLDATTGNESSIVTSIVGLQPNHEYSYAINSVNANWPIKVLPASGTIEVTKDRVSLSHKIMFCANSGLCIPGEPNIMDYTIDPTCSKFNDFFGVLQLELFSNELGMEPILSNPMQVYCNDCLPLVIASIPELSTLTTTNTIDLPFALTNLIAGHEYSYELIPVNANWPVTLSHASGSFVANDDNDTFSTNVTFCPTTGVCQAAGKTVLPFTLDDDCIFGETNRFVDMKLKISSATCSVPDVITDNIRVICNDCIEQIQVTDFIDTIVVNNGNIYPITANVQGLRPNHTYSYSFEALSANWPTTLSVSGGSFTAATNTYTIESNLVFCATTGSCQDLGKTVLPYILDEGCLFFDSQPAVRLQLTVSPISCDQEISKDITNIVCDNCLPEMTITSVEEATLSTANNYYYTLTHDIDGLIEGQQYSYAYEGVSSNWPTLISPTSGTFTAKGVTNSLEAQLMLCYPENLCPSGTQGLFDYTLDSRAQKILKKNVLSTQLKLTVSPMTCGLPSATSDIFTLNCDGCLPSFSYSSINFADTPELMLDGPCCTGMKAITVNVDGAVPGDQYNYVFNSAADANQVSFVPSTGTIYVGGNGTGYINTIMNVNLIDSQQVVINCELTHVNTNIKTMDFLAVKCSGACYS